ncbi:MAG: glycoside hydrolase family 3 protein [Oscillospiraceae bacterium]|nr:glycoside hydrolase family 3 protein [Oscillospiraceae bacterium]
MIENYETAHAELVRRLAPECTVLLKKDGQFPLAAPQEIALFGSGARYTVKGGTGSGEVNSRYSVTVEQGLERAGFTVTSKGWLDAYDAVRQAAKKDFFRAIRDRAKRNHTLAAMEGMGAIMPEPEYQLPLRGSGDTAVYVLSRISGEGSDRKPIKGDILLSDTERRDILLLNEQYEKFMLVLNVGGPVDLSPVQNVKNILLLSQLGANTGDVFADLLLGKSYPSGKLTTTWASWEDYPQLGTFGDQDEALYREGVYVGYRYFDTVGKEPLFPFGFGLGYTDFETKIDAADDKSVTVTVTNVGGYKGKEVVPVYLAPPAEKLDKPLRQLAAFRKTRELAPGESETLTVPYALRDAASYDEAQAAWILEQGDYTVLVGHTPAVTLRLDRTVKLQQLRNALGKPDWADWKPEQPLEARKAENVIPISAESLPTETVVYDAKAEVEPQIAALSDEELISLNIGAFDPKGGMGSMIGNASMSVAGAAGETAHVADLPFLVMADGPAGLRISRQYYKDEKGVHALGDTMPETILELLTPLQRRFMSLLTPKPKKTAEIREQYCTAIPIGTAIAQSWDLPLAETFGNLVGDEMERFGVHLWLAPALNIHRDIRCGRNFEYYSEDPLIGGKFAAAITRGVQKHPGCGTTIKHFTVNNQEYNRIGVNSQVSERAMREIYLRGFEICVRESQPHALMTSYNLLNGTHTSERRDLITDVLRAEWGFAGIVMTDWVIGSISQVKEPRYRNALSEHVAAAGGDLFMPGGKSDWKRVQKALKAGTLSRRQLEENATRVYHMAKKLTEKEL